MKPAPISQTDDWWRSQPDSGAGPFETAVQRDVAAHVYATVEKLDEDVRETVHLHYYQGLTLDETAQALSIAVSTVKYRLQRALEFLREHVEQPSRTH